jgi:hypothetical protein
MSKKRKKIKSESEYIQPIIPKIKPELIEVKKNQIKLQTVPKPKSLTNSVSKKLVLPTKTIKSGSAASIKKRAIDFSNKLKNNIKSLRVFKTGK